jgi:hypothetical protein
MVYGLYALSLVARCATIASVMRSIIANLTPALVRQDHTISPSALAPSVHARECVATPSRPPHPAPNVRDGHETPLLGARDGADYAGDLLRKNRRIFCAAGLDSEAKSPTL